MKDEITNKHLSEHSNKLLELKNARLKIMIVEDNKINMMLVKTIIREILPQSVIYEIENGKQAVDEFININPDLILMDVNMPVMNGLQATEEIRKLQNGNKTPIIALSASTNNEDKILCFKCGMNDYTIKPIDKKSLELSIFKLLFDKKIT